MTIRRNKFLKWTEACLEHLVSKFGCRFHIYIYTLCIIAGCLFMCGYSYPDSVALSGDQPDYQSIAVNYVHGHGFPVSGALQDSAAYKMFYHNGLKYGMNWRQFASGSRGYNFYRNPVYPAFISLVYSLFGIHPAMLYRLQFLLLILTGALLPYCCYRVLSTRGIIIGLCVYGLLLLFDAHYAFDVMCEPIIIPYIISLLFIEKFVIRHEYIGALLWGVAIGIGLLLKNYFFPLASIFFIAWLWKAVFRSEKKYFKYIGAYTLGLILSILPWFIYANHIVPHTQGEPFIFITTQGGDALLDSNNEFSLDGSWHPEWKLKNESYYNSHEVQAKSAIYKVYLFYQSHPHLLLKNISAKIIKGFVATIPQVCFYASLLLLLISRLTISKNIRTLLITSIIIFSLYAVVINRRLLPSWAHTVFTEYIIRYMVLMILTVILLIYFRILSGIERKVFLLPSLILLGFFILTTIFYGNQRITGVADVILFLFTIYNSYDLLAFAEASNHETSTG